MAYNSVSNRAAFNGAPSPWAKNLATIVAGSWVVQGSKGSFSDWLLHTDREFIALPKIDDDVEALVFYGPKLAGSNFGRLIRASFNDQFDELIQEWETFGRAFVHFRVNPLKRHPIEVLNHDGSVRIVNELAAIDPAPTPALEEFDTALGTSLVDEYVLNGDLAVRIQALTGAAKEAFQ